MAVDIAAKKQELTEAIINAYFRRELNWASEGIRDGSCKEGKFKYQILPRSAMAYETVYYVRYPEGTWYQDGGLIGGDSDAPYEPFDAKAYYDEIEAYVDELIDPWVDRPLPEDFDYDIWLLQHAAGKLRVGGTVEIEGVGDKTQVKVDNELVATYIKGIEDELTDLNGVAMKALRDYYGNRLRITMAGQHALVCVVGTMVQGERDAWEKVDSDLGHVVDQAIGAFNDFATSGEASLSDVLHVVQVVGTAASLFGGPVGAAGGAGSTVAGLVDEFLPEEPPATTWEIKGSSYEDMNSSFVQSLLDVRNDLAATEQAFATCAQNAMNAIDSSPTSFRLVRPGQFLGATERNDDVYRTEAGGRDSEVKVDDALKYVAARFELVGEFQEVISHEVGGVTHGGLGTIEAARAKWERPDFLGYPIGLDHLGHYDAYSALAERVIATLQLAAQTNHEVAEKCLKVLADFRLTDELAESRLDRQTERVEQEVQSHL